LGTKDAAIVIREDGGPELYLAIPEDEDEPICLAAATIARLAVAYADKVLWNAIDAVFMAKAEQQEMEELLPEPLEDEE
jgi:hypothetical protein